MKKISLEILISIIGIVLAFFIVSVSLAGVHPDESWWRNVPYPIPENPILEKEKLEKNNEIFWALLIIIPSMLLIFALNVLVVLKDKQKGTKNGNDF